jgi:hypothetical protein
MAPKLFISYRREDSAGYSGRVHDRLQREFGGNLLFMDVDSIPLGVNFSKVLIEEVAKCDVLLATAAAWWLWSALCGRHSSILRLHRNRCLRRRVSRRVAAASPSVAQRLDH